MQIPRSRTPALFSAGFRPFFLGAALWAAVAIPLWLTIYGGAVAPAGLLPPLAWHAHEMVFGFGGATVAGFLLTAIPNWTGRPPLQGAALATLVLLWAAGRVAVLSAAAIGAPAAALVDLAFPASFLAIVARDLVAARNWRNLPILIALTLFLVGNLLVHLDAMGIAATAALGNRIGLAILLMLISLVGGRIIPAFTRNWLARARPGVAAPLDAGAADAAALGVTALALGCWAAAPDAMIVPWLCLAAGLGLAIRLMRWRGLRTLREPLLFVLHAGYFWLAAGLVLLGLDGIIPILPPSAALHALSVGAVGTMTLAVMTRASLGHAGRALSAGRGTQAIYLLIAAAALLRVLSPLAGARGLAVLWLAGLAWCAAFGLFALLYGPMLATRSRAST